MNTCLINCTGEGYKIHITYPWEVHALCGETVRSKKVGSYAYTHSFWCGYCSTLADKITEENNDE